MRILFVMTIVFTVWTYSISAAEEKQPEKKKLKEPDVTIEKNPDYVEPGEEFDFSDHILPRASLLNSPQKGFAKSANIA